MKIQGVSTPSSLQKQISQKMNHSEGINTSPSTSRPTQVLQMHQQHAADYVWPHGGSGNKSAYEGGLVSATHHRCIPLFLSLTTSPVILYLTSGPSVEYYHSFIHYYFLSSFRPSRKSIWQTTFTA